MEKVNLEMVKKLIAENKDKIFSVVFKKRTTGEMRVMNCRRFVKRDLAGGKQSYNFTEKNLLPVFDMNAFNRRGKKGSYRCIPLENIINVKVSGKSYIVNGGK